MDRLRNIVLSVLVPGCLLFEAAAQVAPFPARTRYVSLADGLSQSSVAEIYQDRLGIIWLGTQDGLNRYDGYTVSTFRPDPLDDSTISGKSVSAVVEDTRGRIWIGTDDKGLSRLDRNTGVFKRFRTDPRDSTSISSEVIFSLLVDSRGTVWVGTAGGGLNKYLGDGSGFERIAVPDAERSAGNWIFDLLETRDATIWIATDGHGLHRLDPVTSELSRPTITLPGSDETLDDLIFKMDADEGGVLWLGTPFGLVSYDPASGNVRRFTHEDGNPGSLSHNIVVAVTVDRENRVWAGTSAHGISILRPDRSRFDHITSTNRSGIDLRDDAVYSLFTDRAGGVWVGSESAGVARIERSQSVFTVLANDTGGSDEIRGSDVWAILQDRSGATWIGTADGGLNRIDPSSGRVSQHPVLDSSSTGLADATVHSMYEDSRGRLWMGVDGFGAVRFDATRRSVRRYEYSPKNGTGVSSDLIQVFLEDSSGRLWLGTSGGGLSLYDEVSDSFEWIFPDPDSLSAGNFIQAIAESPDGTLWLGTLDGVVSFDPADRSFEYFKAAPADPEGLSSPAVMHVYAASNDELWLATDDGLNRMVRTPGGWTFERFTTADGLPNDVVYAVMPGARGLLWMSTNRGIAALDPETRTIRSFDVGDGISGYEFNQGAAFSGSDGVLYFGGIGGVTRVNTADFVESTYEPPVAITEFRSYDRRIAADLREGSEIRLKYDQNFVALEFAAMEFHNPEKIRYRYRLEPIEKDWIDAGSRRYVSYAGLPPDDYVFRVTSTNGDGLWSETETSIRIHVEPPYWATLWFRITAAFSLILAMTAVTMLWHRAGLRRLERRHRERIEIQRRINDRLEAERIHLARELHDGPIQSLQLSGFQLTGLEEVQESRERTGNLDQIRNTISDVIQELRGICGNLRPPALVHFGLARALQSYSERFLERYPDIELHLDLPDTQVDLPARTRLGLFRICQEALSNVAKHAGPCQVKIKMTETADTVTLEIQDDGKGFQPPERWEHLARAEHYGLLGASERAEAIDGRLEITSAPGLGVRLQVVAPVRLKTGSLLEKFEDEAIL